MTQLIDGILGATIVTSNQVVVPDRTAATPQGSARIMVANQIPGRRSITLYNAGAVPVYLGGRNVDPFNGFLFPAGASIVLDIAAELWACTFGGTGTCLVTWIAELVDPSGAHPNG